MKKLVALIFAALVAACTSLADVLPDGGPYTETVGGVEYNFIISNGEALLGGSNRWNPYMSAINNSISGAITIPSSLGGCRVTSIQTQAFAFFKTLTSVTIPESVTKICEEAFRGCRSLKSVTIPSSVTYISNKTFYNCTSLTSVTIPDSVTTIGRYAFDGCSSLTSVTIPEGVSTIGDYAFSHCSSLKSVTIPESVAAIGKNAFSGCDNLEAVYISDLAKWCEISFANESANPASKAKHFYLDGEEIKSLEIPQGIVAIGQYAFYGCCFVTSVMIPYGVATIDNYAFYNCSSLALVEIPESVVLIGFMAFSKCDSLEQVFITDLAKWCAIDGHYYLNPMGGCALYLNNVEIRDLIIPDSVIKISSYTFRGCSSLTSVTIPDSVTTIGSDAFYGCSSLTSVTIGNSVTTIGSAAFYGCSSLTSVTIGNSVTTIGGSAFSGCSSLKSVTIPDSVTTIGRYAFSGCSSLTSVSIPNSVTEIGDETFWECDALTTVYVDYGDTTRVKELMRDKGVDVDTLTFVERLPDGGPYTETVDGVEYTFTISNGEATIGTGLTTAAISTETEGALYVPSKLGGCPVTTIGAYAFYGCSSLTSVTIPDSVTSIGSRAFYGCSSLKKVHITDLAKWCAISFGSFDTNPCCYAHHLYLNGEEIKDLVIPDGVTTIGFSAFRGCSSLTSVTIPNSVTTIGSYAFDDCSSLTSVTIPEGVTTIGSNAFALCSSLTSVVIPEGVSTIGEYAFGGCSSLTSVMIPDSVTTISSSMFMNCSSLMSITIPDSVTTIGEWAFYGCSSLAAIVIPEGVTAIGDWAFKGCRSLTSVTIPTSLTRVDISAFGSCENLNAVYISDLAKWCNIWFSTLDSNPCYYTPHLYLNGEKITNLVIPEGVTIIGSKAFLGCSSLTSVTIPSSVKVILVNAFKGCSSLKTVYVYEGDVERVKKIMRGTDVDVDTLTFVEINVDLPEATYSHDFNGEMTTPSSILGGVIIPNRGDTFGSFTHVIREGEPNGAGAVPSTAGGKNGQYGSTELVDDEADWTIAMVAKAANVANGTFWSVGADCWSDGKTGMALVLKDSTHVSLVRWQKGGDGNETLLTAEVPGATEAFHLYTVSYNHETETYTLFVDTTEAASFTGARTFTTNGYQIGSVHGGSGNVNLATANGFVFDDFAVWKGFAAQVKHARKIAKMYTPVVAVGSYTFDWPEGETAWRNDIGFAVGSASGITPYSGDTIRFATGETITFPNGATIPSGIELIIDSGTIKLASGTPSKVTVNAGATLDVAGTPDRNFAIVLNGGTLTNSGNNIGSGYMQTPTIELTADSFIDSSRDFGSIASGYQGHSFNLNGHKLTKRGTGIFYIANATFNSGTIDIEAGSVELMKGYTIPSGATLGLTGSQNGELSVLQVGTQTGAINLSDNLTVRLKITSIPDFVKNATGWTGKLVIAANISGLASIGANTALYGNASEIEIASGASCAGYFPNSARTSRITINGTFTVNDGYTGESKSATVSELAGSGTIVDGIAANNKGATPIVKVEKYDDWNGTIQEATTKKLTIVFLEPISPVIEGDDGAEVTGDAETGFVVKPSEATTDVVITIPEGVDAEKVTLEVSPSVQSVKANGATIKVVKGAADITEFLDIPAAVDGVVNLGAAEVKEEIVKEALDTEKGAVVELSAEEPTLTTAETKPGLTYTLLEGSTLESMKNGDSKLGDGTKWSPNISVKGGTSGFYTIKVTK